MIDTLSKEDDHGKASAALAEWGKDGRARQEWSRKERYFVPQLIYAILPEMIHRN